MILKVLFSYIFRSFQYGGSDITIDNFFTNRVVVNLNVFYMDMKHRVYSHVERIDVVTKNMDRDERQMPRSHKIKVTRWVRQWRDRSTKLDLSNRVGNNDLLLDNPQKQIRIEKNNTPGHGAVDEVKNVNIKTFKHVILAVHIWAHSKLLHGSIHIQTHLSHNILIHYITHLHTYTCILHHERNSYIYTYLNNKPYMNIICNQL